MSQYSRNLNFKSKILNIIDYLTKKKQNPSILFTTKYLDIHQFASFIRVASGLKISPILIGENRVQDAQEKLDFLLASQGEALRSKFTFIMIGNLQKNKINKAIEIFDEIHSIDSVEHARTISQKLSPNRRLPIFLEVNIANDPTKHGFKPEDLDSAISAINKLDNLVIKGLMTMPPFTNDPEFSRPYFKKLNQIRKILNSQLSTNNLLLSMGTSQDWQVAIKEGADIVRIGSLFFN